MTAGYDAMRSADQRFSDALSGADGTGDPAVLMPVLDVYPDALSAPMPVTDIGPGASLWPASRRIGAPVIAVAQPAAPTRGPVPAAGGRIAARERGRGPAGYAPGYAAPAARPSAARAPQPARPMAAPTANWPGSTVSTADLVSNVRQYLSAAGNSASLQRSAAAPSHQQPQASTSPAEVAPAAPTVSQYSAMGQYRNQARARKAGQPPSSRFAVAMATTKQSPRRQSVWAVLVLIVVVLFATGIGQRIVDAVTALFQR